MVLNLLLQVSIPLGFYGLAMQIEGVVFIIITPVLLFTSWWLWRKKAIDRNTLLLGLLPPFYVAAAVLVQLSIHGIIPFHMAIYSLWQYALIVHIITVLIIAILRVRAENRQLEQKQRLARELQIEREASFHQRQFMGMVAHEFRTPLAVILAALENLRLSAASASQEARFDRIGRATTRLVQLTDNCLADARLASHDLHVDRQQTALLAVINMAASVVAISHDHYLNIHHHGAVESPQLQADVGLLCIAIANLLDNAVKYSPPGEITIDIHADAGQTELRIRDYGPGLPAGQAELIFERYRRGEHTSCGAGRLHLYSHPPHGCLRGERRMALRLAIIEDNPDLLDELLAWLGYRGFEVWGTRSAEAFWRQLHSHPVDIVLIDIGLPGEDGFSVLSYLHELGHYGLVVVSARGQQQDKLQALSLGADAYLISLLTSPISRRP